MPVQQDQTQGSIEVTKDSIIDSICNSVIAATATSPPSISAKDSISNSVIDATATSLPSPAAQIRIPRVPRMVRESTGDYEKYYVPKVVSIGPYHFGNKKLESVEKLKPVFTMKLLSNKETVTRLYNKLSEPQMVQDLRSFYEENSTTKFSDMVFAKMMLLDACFIMCYINFIFDGKHKYCPELKHSHIIKFAQQDLLLLENQIPYKVLKEVAQLMNFSLKISVESFIRGSSITKTLWWPMIKLHRVDFDKCDHLLHVLHLCLTSKVEAHRDNGSPLMAEWFTSCPNASELADVGIQFKPNDSMSLTSVEFSSGWLRFSANVKLPRTRVNGSTKHILLNLIAYETCLCSVDDAWVTSYVCLLDSLIDRPEDVKILKKSWVLETSLGSDEEVAKLFNEIASDLVPNRYAYLETKYHILTHYGSVRNILFSQLKNEYFRSPWAVFVLLGALLALFLSAVQTYLSLTGECDDLCKLLKNRYF